MAKVGNWVIESCSTVGQGDIILAGSDVGFATFLDALPAGPVWYSIEDGTSREAGFGEFNGSNTITRANIGATLVANVYDNDISVMLGLSSISLFNNSGFSWILPMTLKT